MPKVVSDAIKRARVELSEWTCWNDRPFIRILRMHGWSQLYREVYKTVFEIRILDLKQMKGSIVIWDYAQCPD